MTLMDEFLDVLRSIDFDFRYLACCRKRKNLDVGNAMWVIPEAMKEAVDRLPLEFRHTSESGFCHEENFGEFKIHFNILVQDPIVSPMIYLEVAGKIIGDNYAGLAIDIMESRQVEKMPANREFALRYSSSRDLYDALEFATALFLDAREALLKASPWSG